MKPNLKRFKRIDEGLTNIKEELLDNSFHVELIRLNLNMVFRTILENYLIKN